MIAEFLGKGYNVLKNLDKKLGKLFPSMMY